MENSQSETAPSELRRLVDLVVSGKLHPRELTQAERRLILDSRSDLADSPFEIKRRSAKASVADLERDDDSRERRSSAIGSMGAAAFSEADFAESRATQKVSNSKNAQGPRFRDELALLIYFTIKDMTVIPVPNNVIPRLGRIEQEQSECDGTLRAHSDRFLGSKLNPTMQSSYYKDDLVHWWHKGKPDTATREQINQRIQTARKRLKAGSK